VYKQYGDFDKYRSQEIENKLIERKIKLRENSNKADEDDDDVSIINIIHIIYY
jgi:hypothetical protein